MDANNLEVIAKQLVVEAKGILASDSSTGSIKKRFDRVGIESTEESRRAFRNLFFTTKDIEEYISGVIMFDETIRQKTDDGVPFPKLLFDKGILPGIKVDKKAWTMPNFPDEKLTEGLDGLRDRLIEYKELGAKFTKWRTVIAITTAAPTRVCIESNVDSLARYAALCQEAGLVPVVEPEVIMDGNHNIDKCAEVTKEVITAMISRLIDHKVSLEGIILKANMVLPGKDFEGEVSDEEIADKTIDTLKDSVSIRVPGVVFLSGGQSAVDATRRLNAISKIESVPWPTTFSFERALQEPSLEVWAGKEENVMESQKVFIKRAKLNSLASQGKYNNEMEEDE